MAAADDTRGIGYFAYASLSEVVCEEDACIIAGSDVDPRTYIPELGPGNGINHTLKKTRFGEIMHGMRLGAAYAFDETAYNRFYPLAKREGFDLVPEDFAAQFEKTTKDEQCRFSDRKQQALCCKKMSA